MDEATAVLDRLARIQALEAEQASPRLLLDELRALLLEAEAWARLEGGERGTAAVERLRAALARDLVAA